MPRKKSPKRKPISEKLRAEDEKLREMLRHADMKKFDALVEKAITPRQRGNA